MLNSTGGPAVDDAVRTPSGPPPPMERWERVDEPERSRRSTRRPDVVAPIGSSALDGEVATAIRAAATSADAAHREFLVRRMDAAVAAYDRHRFAEAARLARTVADEVPSVPAVRQLAGLAAYRAGRYREAARQLEAYGVLTDDVDLVPVLMDSQRALGRPRRVADLWSDLRRSSPGAEPLAEARIVAAASLADGGDLSGAIALLSGAGVARALRNPADRHLRQWYVLADLYERAGDLPRARQLFSRVVEADPESYDAADRLDQLGPARTGRPRRRAPGRTGPPKRSGRGPQGGAGEARRPSGPDHDPR